MTMKDLYRKRAQQDYAEHTDDIEINEDARVTRVDEGGWVQAWVWVYPPICAGCCDTIESARGVVIAKDGALYHGRCWRTK